MKYLINFLFCFFSIPVYSQIIPIGVYTELAKFTDLPINYIETLPDLIHQKLLHNESAHKNIIQNNCASKTNVKYINQLTASNNTVINDFESGFVLVDVTMCFNNTTVDKVMNLFMNREFQANNISTIKSSYAKNHLICEKTQAPTLGKSHYCYNQQIKKMANSILNVSFNEWNDLIENADAPVYFREVMASATQTNINVIFHLQTMVRGPKLNSFKKIMAESFIVNEQNSIYEKMKQLLQN